MMVLAVTRDHLAGPEATHPDPWQDAVKVSRRLRRLRPGRQPDRRPRFVCSEPGIEGLIHISEISWTRRLRHPGEVLKEGEVVQVRVLDVDLTKKRISLSYKQTEPDPWTLAAESTPEGSFFEGEVTGLTDFGAFVRLPCGVDGMIHVSDLSWTRRVRKPSEMLKKGDRVKVKVLEINPAEQRIALGLKQAEEDPWAMVPVKYPVGSIVEVTVGKLADFGAFCELEEGVEGLAHISELSETKVGQIGDVLKVGDRVKMKVVKIDPGQRRIGLSVKALERGAASPEDERYANAAPDAPLANLGELLAPLMESARAEKKAQEQQGRNEESS
ncbi:S1 RNA-binding domain-containing protein [bacterium]|nr:S1 RNA-binding domain-containing protein [bacterium]